MCQQCADGECLSHADTVLHRLRLQAVNVALQQRTTTTLDLDTTLANHVPDDYDTDLESPWSNQSGSP